MHALRETSPRCSVVEANRSYASAAEGSCRVRCHKRLIFCDFRNTFDVKHRYRKPFAPWAAGQWLVKRVLGRLGTLDPLPRPLRVLLVDRCQLPTHDTYAQGMNAGGYASNGTENIHNIDELLHLCAKQRGLQCSSIYFGSIGLAASMRAVRAAGVLVGTHGSGLTRGFFMPRGASVVEVRQSVRPPTRSRAGYPPSARCGEA